MPDTFKALQWNVGGQEPDHVEAELAGQIAGGVTVASLQETKPRTLKALDRLGMRHHTTGWVTTAWMEVPWVTIISWSGLLTELSWTSGDGKRFLQADIDLTILCEPLGRTLLIGSDKLPPDTQDGEGRRVDIAMGALLGKDILAEDSHTTAVLFGSDDNYDTDTGNVVPDLHRMAAMSPILRLHKSIQPTLGDREIDVFRTIRPSQGGRLRPVGKPWVGGNTGKGIHRYHGREFAWT